MAQRTAAAEVASLFIWWHSKAVCMDGTHLANLPKKQPCKLFRVRLRHPMTQPKKAMAQIPDPLQELSDWLAHQQSLMRAMTASVSDASAAAWPLPSLEPRLQETLVAMFQKFGIAMPEASQGMPSLADAMLGRLTRAPTFAHLWDLDRKLVGLMGAWTKLHAANEAYRMLVTRAWVGAQQGAIRRASQKTSPDPSGTVKLDGDAALDDWLLEVNDALLGLMRTDEYVKAQQQLLNAGMEMREQLRKMGDEVAEWLQLPGREEVDDLARSVADMRRQLRRITKAQADAADANQAMSAKPLARRRSNTR